tara:strand:- start:3435 stop:3563 length:129 start_codon:yes stop_codon:yes gene_type:complete
MPPKKLSAWNKHVGVVFKAGKKKDPKYSFVQALKDAKKTYKK